MTHANECTCAGPGEKKGTTCGRQAQYWRGPNGREVPVCYGHYQQLARRGGRMKPLAQRNRKNPVGTCAEPGDGKDGKCGRPGPYTKFGSPMCDTHAKQQRVHGFTWIPGTPRPGKEAA